MPLRMLGSISRFSLVALLTLAVAAVAAEPKLKGSKKETAPKLDLGLPTFKELPKEQLKKSTDSDTQQIAPSASGPEETWTVLGVVHGKAFIRTPDGAKPSTPFPQVNVTTGNPWTTEKFSTIVRVKHPKKKSASIDVVILDPRGDTVMDASGQLVYRAGEVAEWTVDWEPTSIRNPGDFQVLVRIGGNPIGTYPLKFAEAPKDTKEAPKK